MHGVESLYYTLICRLIYRYIHAVAFYSCMHAATCRLNLVLVLTSTFSSVLLLKPLSTNILLHHQTVCKIICLKVLHVLLFISYLETVVINVCSNLLTKSVWSHIFNKFDSLNWEETLWFFSLYRMHARTICNIYTR